MFRRNNARAPRGAAAKRRTILIACGAGMLLAGLAWGLTSGKKPVTANEAKVAVSAQNVEELLKLPAEERKQKLRDYGRALSAEIGPPREPGARPQRPPEGGPGGPGGPMREVMQKLSEEDRAAFREGFEATMRKRFHEEMQKKVDAFFKATPEEQEKMLEEDLARMKERDAERQKREAAGKQDGERKGPNPMSESKDKREDHLRNMLDDTSPDTRVQMQEYFTRLHNKASSSK